MTTTTQQILCCVGATVASRPTQFIMERAFATLGHDWRALTVEVAHDNFAAALKGMAAMGFRALRIYPSLSSEAAKLLCSGDCTTSFVGNATSAELIDGNWKCWDNNGFGLVEWLSQRLNWAQTAVFLDGDGLVQRSFLAAMSETFTWPRTLIWSRPPNDLPDWIQKHKSHAADRGDNAHATPSLIAINVTDEHGELSHPIEDYCVDDLIGPASSADSAVPLTHLVAIADDPRRLADLPLMELCERGLERVMALQEDDAHRSTLRQKASPQTIAIERIPSAEVLVECEAYDFNRWTGQNIDRALIQDAYDEFSDF
jgi:shikimate 5-dehydrogenase